MKDSNARRNMPNVKSTITTRKTFFSMQSPRLHGRAANATFAFATSPRLLKRTEGKAHPLNYLLDLHNITKFTIHTYFIQ
jgi:hypothetical protein